MSNILQVENVSKTYVGYRALTDVSLEVPEGQVYGLLGPNGAGKTTLIRIINHITAPDSGQVLFDGRPLTADDVAHIGYLPEERGLYKKMKVGEQALFFARLKGMSRADAMTSLKMWFERLGISSWWDKKVEELSKGMAQKVQFIVTVLHNPKLLIFDEPFSGFDPINAQVLKNEILELRSKGATVIFSTHNMESVEELCDHITLINRSRNILSGQVDDVRRRFADNTYRISCAPTDSNLITAAIDPAVKQVSVTHDQRTAQDFVTFSLKSSEDLRTVIGLANNAAVITSFNPVVPSMNDIFISAVEASNIPTPPPVTV